LNPEGYSVDHDALAMVGVANPDGLEDGDLLHPIVFAKRWAWHCAAENAAIPPLTSAWVTLVRYIAAHLHYITGDDRDAFHDDLSRLRGTLGAMVNENGLSQGEAVAMSALNGHEARKRLRAWALTSDRTMRRKDIAKAFPSLTDREWAMLRKRKQRSSDPIPPYEYPVRWAAEIAPDDDAPIYAMKPEKYRDAMNVRSWYSLDEMRDAEERSAWGEEQDDPYVTVFGTR